MLRYLLSHGAMVPKLRGSHVRPDIVVLVWFWVAFIGVLLTGALVLQALGPPQRRAAALLPMKPTASGVATAEPAPTISVPVPRAESEAPVPFSSERAVAALPSPAEATPQPRRVMPEPSSPAPPVGTVAGANPSSADMPAVSSQSAAPHIPAPPTTTQGMAVAPNPQPHVAEPAFAGIQAPEMVSLAGGTFRMGSGEDRSERPVHTVTVRHFLIAKYPVTVKQWRACVAAKECTHVADGGDNAPVSNVSWTDAQQFIAWLSQASRQHYRLPSEAEWEYAARGGTETRYWWGNSMKPGLADCKGCGGPRDGLPPEGVGALPPNPFGLHDIVGGIAEWVEDCWHKDYHGAPADGSAWLGPDCRQRVLRGGSWRNDPSYVRPASRNFYDATVRYPAHGLRLARSIAAGFDDNADTFRQSHPEAQQNVDLFPQSHTEAGQNLSQLQKNRFNEANSQQSNREIGASILQYSLGMRFNNDAGDWEGYHSGDRFGTGLAVGETATALPTVATAISVAGHAYYYADGVYFAPQGAQYRVVPPPQGAVVATLPPSCSKIYASTTFSLYCGGAFYSQVSSGYQVIPPPIGATVNTLPRGAVERNIDGTTYFTYGGAYFRPFSFSSGASVIIYQVVAKPG